MEHSELLIENLELGRWHPDPDVIQELTHLALATTDLTHLSSRLFQTFRGVSGQDVVEEYIGAMLRLAASGTPAGARLLAAFLNVALPGDRLVPLVRRMDATRRYATRLGEEQHGHGPFQTDWLERLERIGARAKSWADRADLDPHTVRASGPRGEEPWRTLQSVLADLLDRCVEDGFAGPEEGANLLVDMLRLEVDARQERTSLIAGDVHPFRVETVARVLPLLTRADGAIRDLRHLIAATAAGDIETAFMRPLARWRETLDDKDWGRLYHDLQRRPDFEGLMKLAEGLSERPIELPQLAWGTRRIIDLSEALVAEGARSEPLDLLTACVIAQANFGNGQIVLTVDPELGEAIAELLPPADAVGADHPLAGIGHMAGLIVIDLPGEATAWPDGLPVLREMDEDEERELRVWRREHRKHDPSDLEALRTEALTLTRVADGIEDAEEDDEVLDMDNAALKHLVLTNLQSVSIMLGFLRNPKVYSIPGLVEDVVNRSRNPQIIETIANDRALHTGFANKGVALACLRSPVNVSIKTLRKFCHVKYVSKVDLKRLAADRTGIRKEVAREIEKYLEALA